ncbi:MAG: hypothetical protein QOJ12_3190 [Thermoleophilales bacterium]|jgi:hypothetical protein|nr:hypothetical protein [Thermoleophilales bacterium]
MPMVVPGQNPPREPEPPANTSLFAHIEGLVGEEDALLAIPPHERSDGHHARLREIAAELDRIFETLRERAARLAERPPADRPAT